MTRLDAVMEQMLGGYEPLCRSQEFSIEATELMTGSICTAGSIFPESLMQ